MTVNNIFLGVSLWAVIHIVFELSKLFFKDGWRKNFQIFIGIILILVAFKFLWFYEKTYFVWFM